MYSHSNSDIRLHDVMPVKICLTFVLLNFMGLINYLLFRFLIMDLCLGSMRAYCQDKLPDVKDLDIIRVMWETASGLEYLHSEKVIHGCLVLDKILLWRKRPIKSNPIVKLTGHIPTSYHGGNEVYNII